MEIINNQHQDDWLYLLDNLFSELSNNIKQKELYFDKDGFPKNAKLDLLKVQKIKSLLLEHAPDSLYRYRRGTEKDIENLRENKIWMSIPSEFNDPFDFKVYVNCESVAKELINANPEIKVLMLTRGITEEDPIYMDFLNEIKTKERELNEELMMKRDRVYMSCLSEKRNSLLMWSHYADCHTGFCIGYNFKQLFEVYGINLLPVGYSNDFFVIDTLRKFANHKDIFMKAARTKSLEWSYEKEWRILGSYKINESNQKGMLLDMPIPCSIYMGCRIKKDVENQLKNILYKMQLSKRSYNLIPNIVLKW